MAPGIVTVTINPSIDKSCSVDRVVPEHKLRCSDPRRDAGGGGVNVARVVHRLGGEVVAHWSSGGHIGTMLGELLDAAGVPHQPLPIAGVSRENLIVSERTTDQQFRFGMPGPPLAKEEQDNWCDRLRALDPQPDYLVLSGSLNPGVPEDFYARLARAVPAKTRIVLDTSGESLRRALETCPFLVKPNFRELQQIVGRELDGDEEIARAAQEMLERRCAEAVVVSLGQAGALLCHGGETEYIRAPSVRIASRVGAGDSMVGGIVFRLAAGDSVSRAARYGVAAGVAAVMTEATELCHPEDVERIFSEIERK